MQRLLVTCALVTACAVDPPAHEDVPGVDVDDATGTPPELEPAHATVRVVYESPSTAPDLGTTITLRGEGSLATDTPCTRLDARTCVASISAFPAGHRELAFRAYLGGVPSRGARYVVARNESLEIAPHFVRTQGTLLTFSGSFHFDALEAAEPNNARRIWTYLPASYGENTAKRYPVVYMHDGRNLFDSALSITGVEWEVDETADRAWEETGAFAEVIIVGIDQFVTVDGVLGNYRQGEYNPTPDQGILNRPPSGTAYAQAIALELKPRIDAALRTLPGPENTATLGSSLGSTISAWIAHAYPSTFGNVGLMSPATGIDNEWIIDQLLAERSEPHSLQSLYIDGSVNEAAIAGQYIDAYHQLGYVDGDNMRSYLEVGAYHDETSWARRLPFALAALFPDRRTP